MLSNFSSFLAILRYWNSLECRQFMNFLWKRSQILLPGADYERKIHVAGLLGQRFLKENWKWRTKRVSGQINEEGNKKVLFFLAAFKQLFSQTATFDFFEKLYEKLRETFWEISSNLWKALVWIVQHVLSFCFRRIERLGQTSIFTCD